jgi:hypothetical protein
MAEKNVILVEGVDDEHVVKHVYGGNIPTQQFEVRENKGYPKLKKILPVVLDESDLKRLGIVVDADEDVKSRWEELLNIFNQAGYENVPSIPDSKGTILTAQEKPVVGIWIMPNNQISGKLEDFLSLMVPPNDSLWPIAQKAVESLPNEEKRFKPKDVIKATIHTWLAWQERPGKRFGAAIHKNFLDANAPHAQDFRNWLNKLLTV